MCGTPFPFFLKKKNRGVFILLRGCAFKILSTKFPKLPKLPNYKKCTLKKRGFFSPNTKKVPFFPPSFSFHFFSLLFSLLGFSIQEILFAQWIATLRERRERKSNMDIQYCRTASATTLLRLRPFFFQSVVSFWCINTLKIMTKKIDFAMPLGMSLHLPHCWH